jgi:hypothetical protein
MTTLSSRPIECKYVRRSSRLKVQCTMTNGIEVSYKNICIRRIAILVLFLISKLFSPITIFQLLVELLQLYPHIPIIVNRLIEKEVIIPMNPRLLYYIFQ